MDIETDDTRRDAMMKYVLVRAAFWFLGLVVVAGIVVGLMWPAGIFLLGVSLGGLMSWMLLSSARRYSDPSDPKFDGPDRNDYLAVSLLALFSLLILPGMAHNLSQ